MPRDGAARCGAALVVDRRIIGGPGARNKPTPWFRRVARRRPGQTSGGGAYTWTAPSTSRVAKRGSGPGATGSWCADDLAGRGEDRGVARAVERARRDEGAGGSRGGCTSPTPPAGRRRCGARTRRRSPGRRPGPRPRAGPCWPRRSARHRRRLQFLLAVRSVGAAGDQRGRRPHRRRPTRRRALRPAPAGAVGRTIRTGVVPVRERRVPVPGPARRPAAGATRRRTPPAGASAPGRAARSSIATRSSSASAGVARNGRGRRPAEQVVEVAAQPAPGHGATPSPSRASRRQLCRPAQRAVLQDLRVARADPQRDGGLRRPCTSRGTAAPGSAGRCAGRASRIARWRGAGRPTERAARRMSRPGARRPASSPPGPVSAASGRPARCGRWPTGRPAPRRRSPRPAAAAAPPGTPRP